MAELGQESGEGIGIEPAPGSSPSFLCLPDGIHYNIASFLPDGNKKNGSRLRASEVSPALRGSYGGSLTVMCIRYVKGSSVARLVALLRRQQFLHQVTVKEQDAIPMLCFAIAQGCCEDLLSIHVSLGKAIMTSDRLSLLVGALETEGALAGLTALRVDCT
jgi:hypothetical protein